MKQYTDEIQTAKLIELGFEKPKMAAPALKWVDGEPTFEPQYTIGELIEKLPLYRIEFDMEIWVDTPRGGFYAPELIDALFEACVKFKSEGVI
jgi:hypothetical protein